MHKIGKLKILASGGSSRLDILPNISTLSELYGEFTINSFFGIYVSKNTPINIKQELNTIWENALDDPEIIKMFDGSGRLILGGDLKKSKLIYDKQYNDSRDRVNKYTDK
jgi:tripartite-type tricarboxylate transporter receptor subunit TctC